ncbi:MAG: hypothetical protein ACPG5R_04690 [Cognaticolwellia aestuarii]
MLEINNITSNAHGTLFIKPEFIILNKSLNKFWLAAENYRFAQFTDEDSLLNIIKLAIESEQHIVLLDDGINHEIKSILAELTHSFSIIPYNTIPEVAAANDILKSKSSASEVISAQLLNIHCVNESRGYLPTKYKNGFKQHIAKLAVEGELENLSSAESFIEPQAIEDYEFSLTLNHDGKNIFNLRSSEISHISNKNQNGLLYFKWKKTETDQTHLVFESNEILQSTNYVLSELSKASSISISHLFELESLIEVLAAKIKTLGSKQREQEAYALVGLYLIEQAVKLALQLNRRTNAYFLNRKGVDFALFYIDKNGKNTFISELIFNHYLATSKLDLYRDIVNFDLKKCGQYLSNLNKSEIYVCSNLDKLNLHIQRAALFSKFKFKHYAELELNQIEKLTFSEEHQSTTAWYLKFAHIAIHHENAFQYKRKTADILQGEDIKEALEKLSTVVYNEFTNLSFEYFDRELISTFFDLSHLYEDKHLFKRNASSAELDKWVWSDLYAARAYSGDTIALANTSIELTPDILNGEVKGFTLKFVGKGNVVLEVSIHAKDDKPQVMPYRVTIGGKFDQEHILEFNSDNKRVKNFVLKHSIPKNQFLVGWMIINKDF